MVLRIYQYCKRLAVIACVEEIKALHSRSRQQELHLRLVLVCIFEQKQVFFFTVKFCVMCIVGLIVPVSYTKLSYSLLLYLLFINPLTCSL